MLVHQRCLHRTADWKQIYLSPPLQFRMLSGVNAASLRSTPVLLGDTGLPQDYSQGGQPLQRVHGVILDHTCLISINIHSVKVSQLRIELCSCGVQPGTQYRVDLPSRRIEPEGQHCRYDPLPRLLCCVATDTKPRLVCTPCNFLSPPWSVVVGVSSPRHNRPCRMAVGLNGRKQNKTREWTKITSLPQSSMP